MKKSSRTISGALKSDIRTVVSLAKNVSLKKHVYLEQIVYLIFLKLIDLGIFEEKIDQVKEEETSYQAQLNRYEWKYWSKLDEKNMANYIRNIVFPYWSNIESKNRIINEVLNNAKFQIESDSTVYKIVQILDGINFIGLDKKDSNLLFDELVNGLFIEGGSDLGQYPTPRELASVIIKLLDPEPNMKILDPACGTGMFLAEAFRYMDKAFYKTNEDDNLFGIDISRSMVRLSMLNMVLNGATNPNIYRADYVRHNSGYDEYIGRTKYDRVIVEPPFRGMIQYDEIREDIRSDSKRTEILFLKGIIKSLKIDGIAAVILPDNFLMSSIPNIQMMRKTLIDKYRLLGIISIPKRIYRHMGISLSVYIIANFEKDLNNYEEKLLFFDLEESVNQKQGKFIESFHAATEELLQLWGKYKASDYTVAPGYESNIQITSENEPYYWWVYSREIKDKNYDLSFNLYRPLKKEAPTRTKDEIWGNIEHLNAEIIQIMGEMKRKMEGLDE